MGAGIEKGLVGYQPFFFVSTDAKLCKGFYGLWNESTG